MDKNKTVVTAVALLTVFKSHPAGELIGTAQLRDDIRAGGGDPRYLQQAAKHLRDRGVPVCTYKRRHRSAWFCPSSTEDLALYGDRCVSESYSEMVSLARSATKDTRSKFVTTAVMMGERLGVPPEEVVKECRPRRDLPGAGAA